MPCLGGNVKGTRLNQKVIEKKKVPEILELLDSAFAEWKQHAEGQETFGDFANRVGPETLIKSEES